MATSNPYGSGRFKINVNRVRSKKWKDADKVDYGGGWGDDDSDDGYDEPAPVSADNPRHPAWNAAPSIYPPNRSVASSSPSRVGQRPSFDRGEEPRHFASAGNFDSPYPTTQRSPFPELQQEYEPSAAHYGMQPALRLNTQDQGPTAHGGFRSDSRGRPYAPYDNVPMSAPGSFPHQRRSGSSTRPVGDTYARHESPLRPDSRASQTSYRQFPPRKQSLTQAAPPSDFTHGSHSPALSHSSVPAAAVAANEDRPAPAFIRPSDIYKRMNEEMEKVRKSQDSSRPSTASDPHKARESSVGARSTASDPKEPAAGAQPVAEDSDSTRRLKPTLDPVPERKSEYGFENLVRGTNPEDDTQPEEPPIGSNQPGVTRQGTNASSIYTDRPDPVSASSLSRNQSMDDGVPQTDPTSHDRPNFGLPPISRMSDFATGINPSDHSAADPAPHQPTLAQPARESPSHASAKEEPSRDMEGPDVRGLRHQPTMGYTSVVQQGFDQSQYPQEPPDYSSTSRTIDRSNSASTAELSPIISRKLNSGSTSATMPSSHPKVPEESPQKLTTTLRSDESQPPRGNDFFPPAAFRPGYRRDITPPSRDNSPAKRPLELGPRGIVQPQHGSLDEEPTVQEQARGRASSIKDKPLPAAPEADTAMLNTALSSAVLRTESPPKGTVRDLAGRLESSSGRSSPTNSSGQAALPGYGQGRPTTQARLESFRPSIPGGWQSYTSSGPATPGAKTTGANTPGRGAMSPPRAQFAQIRTDSTDSIPTARAPTKNTQGVTQRAFAAAASAGSALAGAFASPSNEHDQESSQQPSEAESENEWDRSSSSSDDDTEPPAPATLPPSPEEHAPARSAQQVPALLAAAIPLPVATPDQLQSVAASTPLSIATSSEDVPQSTLEYFPAPLRTTRSIEPSSTRPSVPNISTSQEIPPDSETERLQQEIVNSLTPKASNLEDESWEQGRQPPTAPYVPIYQSVTTAGPGPQEASATRSIAAESMHSDPRIASPSEPSSLPVSERRSTKSPPSQSAIFWPVDTRIPGDATAAINSPQGQNTSKFSQPSSGPLPQSDSESRRDAALANTGLSQPRREEETTTSEKPFLKQRFSWETGSSPPASVTTPKPTSSPPSSSPDTIRAPFQSGPSSPDTFPPTRQVTLPIQPPAEAMEPPTTPPSQPPSQPPQAAAPRVPEQPNPSPQASRFPPTAAQVSQPQRPPSGEPPGFRAILNFGSPVERIRAFEDSRRFYAAPNDQLQNWLMSMKTPENSELFASNGRGSLETSESSVSHKPSPRRILTDSGRALQMQEGGKKAMAAAGRFGGRAGVAAKGLFAKGKERMRNASSGEKVVH